LAALPFRRYQSTPDASAAPAALSGPAQSALDKMPKAEADHSTIAVSSLDALPTWNPEPAPQPPRQIDIPLTYEDLAMPIDQPAAIQQRFNATAAVRQQQIERQRESGLVMPSMEAMTLDQREQIETLPAPTATDEGRAGGQLASSTPSEPQFQPLPQPLPETRQHHWIRQP